MAQDESTFNSAAYLAQYPDVARALGQPNVESAWAHYQNYGKNEGRQATFAPEPETEKGSRYFNEAAYLANNPDVAAAIGQPGVESAYNHYINFGKNEGRQASFDVSNETARINELSNEIYDAYKSNLNYDAQYKELQSLKDKDPEAYYAAELKFLGQQVGWQIGQNTNERNAPTIERIQGLLPDAINAGLNTDQINSIVGTSINTANAQNQQRIINEQQSGGGGFNLAETLRGIAPVAAFAIGAPLMAGAFGAGAAGGAALETAGAAGLTGGGAFVPAAGSGASFLLPGAAAAPLTTAQILSSTGFTPTAGSSFSIAPGAAYTASNPLTTTEILNSTGFTPTEGNSFYIDPNATYTNSIASYPGDAQYEAQGLEEQARNTNVASGNPTSWDAAAGSSLLSNAGDLLKGAQLAKGLLGAGQNPLQAQAMGVQQPQQMQQRQYAGVDYSPILNLLAVKSPTRNINSLLG